MLNIFIYLFFQLSLIFEVIRIFWNLKKNKHNVLLIIHVNEGSIVQGETELSFRLIPP